MYADRDAAALVPLASCANLNVYKASAGRASWVGEFSSVIDEAAAAEAHQKLPLLLTLVRSGVGAAAVRGKLTFIAAAQTAAAGHGFLLRNAS